VYDNLDLSSSSSDNSEEFHPVGSRIQIGRIKPPPPVENPKPEKPFLLKNNDSGKQSRGSSGFVTEKQSRPLAFFKANRPPSRHKTPPKALGLDLPETPHTPPKTQKELEDYKEYSHTINLKGINLLNKEISKEKAPQINDSFDSDDSFSSSIFIFLPYFPI